MQSTIEELIQELKSALNEAQNEASSAEASSGLSGEFAADLAQLAQEIESLQQGAEATQKTLSQRDKRTRAKIEAYKNELSAVAEDLGTEGPLAAAKIEKLKDMVTDALPDTLPGTVTEITLRADVQAYDDATAALRTAGAEPDTSDVDTKATAYAAKQQDLELIETQIREAATNAKALHAQLLWDKDQLKQALELGQVARAVLHLEDFIDHREQLTAAGQLHPNPPRYDGDLPADAATVYLTAWEAVHSAYQTALIDYMVAQMNLVEQKSEAAEKLSEAEEREAARIVDAVAQVQAVLDA